MNLQIIKRDGSLENYSEEKIRKVVVAAGLKLDQAKLLTHNITYWLKTKTFTKLSSLKLRDQVNEELKKINKEAHDLYTWYQKTRE